MEQVNLFGDNLEENKKDKVELKEAKKEITSLKKIIAYHAKKYYMEDKPEITDYEYDMMMQKLKDLENRYPSLVTKTSPTQRVIGNVNKGFKEVEHNVVMQSLQDVFNFDEITDFVNKMKLLDEKTEFVVEMKIDGLSVSLEYVNGVLERGSTRGNGLVGEEITKNLKTIANIPHKLNEDITIEVRGEVYLPKKEFERLNTLQIKQDKSLFANPRNAAAGTLRQLDINLVKERKLDIFVFNVQKIDTDKYETHHDILEYCKKLGINIIPYSKECNNVEEVMAAIQEIGELRKTLPFEIDGAVVKVNNLKQREMVGTTSKVPKWAVAYKYPPERKETKLLDIQIQVGRTGAVTPLAIIEPVSVAGSTISKTTLHNFDYIKQKDIRIGDSVIIQKAGDVIPEVVEVVLTKRSNDSKEFEVPKLCPICYESLEKEENEAILRCTNSECPAQLYRSIVHFASRECMDIDGMGEALVASLIEKKLVADVADIYYIKYSDVMSLSGFKEKSAFNIINAIEQSKNNKLDKLLFGLGIRYIGGKSAKILSDKFEDIYAIMSAKKEEFNEIEEIGEVMADSLVTYFSKDKTIEIIQKLDKAGVNLKGSKKEIESNIFEGKAFCITGSFDGYKREELAEKIELNSGKISSAISSKTNYLLAGENAGSKLTKAEKLGVEIIDVGQLFKMLK